MIVKIFPNAKSAKDTPMETDFHKRISEQNKILEKYEYPFHLRSVIGLLQWLANATRPDIAYTTNALASLQEKPTVEVFQAASRW